MIYLPPNPDYYRDLPRVLANLPEQQLTTEERRCLQARSSSIRTSPMHFRLMNWIGKSLAVWGEALTKRYSSRDLDSDEQLNQPV